MKINKIIFNLNNEKLKFNLNKWSELDSIVKSLSKENQDKLRSELRNLGIDIENATFSKASSSYIPHTQYYIWNKRGEGLKVIPIEEWKNCSEENWVRSKNFLGSFSVEQTPEIESVYNAKIDQRERMRKELDEIENKSKNLIEELKVKASRIKAGKEIKGESLPNIEKLIELLKVLTDKINNSTSDITAPNRFVEANLSKLNKELSYDLKGSVKYSPEELDNYIKAIVDTNSYDDIKYVTEDMTREQKEHFNKLLKDNKINTKDLGKWSNNTPKKGYVKSDDYYNKKGNIYVFKSGNSILAKEVPANKILEVKYTLPIYNDDIKPVYDLKQSMVDTYNYLKDNIDKFKNLKDSGDYNKVKSLSSDILSNSKILNNLLSKDNIKIELSNILRDDSNSDLIRNFIIYAQNISSMVKKSSDPSYLIDNSDTLLNYLSEYNDLIKSLVNLLS